MQLADRTRRYVLIQSEAAQYAFAVAAFGIALGPRLVLQPLIGSVWGDRNRLHRVFDNLIGNAIKFTPEGGRITVSAAVKGQDVLFSVADTGRGIAPDGVPHVFDRFWQAATRARRLGAGLVEAAPAAEPQHRQKSSLRRDRRRSRRQRVS